MSLVIAWVQSHSALLLLLNSGLLLAVTLWVVALGWRLRRVHRRYRDLLQGPEGTHLGDLLESCLLESQRAADSSQQVDDRIGHLDGTLSQCLQRIGLVRFDAYDSVGGQLSFALAMLDQEGNGVILTSLYGRQDCRVYARAIEGGRCEAPLSEEERTAVAQALGRVSVPA